METKDELKAPETKETIKEIYQPQPDLVCDTNDKECLSRLLEISDCV